MPEPHFLHVGVTALMSPVTAVGILWDDESEPFVLLSGDFPGPNVTLTTIAGLPALECAAAWRALRSAADRVVREFERRATEEAVSNG